MREYYDHLARGIGRAEVLRQAKRQPMSQPRYAHLYYWPAFLLADDWRQLDPWAFAALSHTRQDSFTVRGFRRTTLDAAPAKA